MFAINTVLRLLRFVSNSFVGLVIGFVLGVMFSEGTLASFVHSLFGY